MLVLVAIFLAWQLRRDRLFLYNTQFILGPSIIIALWFALPVGSMGNLDACPAEGWSNLDAVSPGFLVSFAR